LEGTLETLFSRLLDQMRKNVERIKFLAPYWEDLDEGYHPDVGEKFHFAKIYLIEGEEEIEKLFPEVMALLDEGNENDPRIFEMKTILKFARNYYPPKFSESPRWAVELPDHAKIVIEGEGIDFF
jgi:hypothetical protein